MLDREDPRIKWFQEARFGLFIHWGLYSATEGYWNGKETAGIGEWIASREKIPQAEYERFAEKLTCDKFEPAMWAKLAKNAGMRYCVFTAKHHEGFAMYDTSYDDYSIVKRSPYGKDATMQVVEAMREEGIVPCLYYSQALDFHEENAMGNTWDYTVPEENRDMWSYINGKCKHQLTELLTNYGELGMVWMDVPKGLTDDMALEIKSLIGEYQPECLISGRITYDNKLGDFGCFGDNQIPAGKPEFGCWETASTMNNTWGYKRDDHHFKSPKEIIELLCGLLAKGTNLLLNIGPKPNGEIPEESIYTLKEIADWYQVNGEAVNGTEGSPFDCDFSFGGASQRDNVIYLYVYDKIDSITIYGIENKVMDVTVLGGGALDYTQDGSLCIDMSDVAFGKYVTVVKVTLDGKPVVKKRNRQLEKGRVILSAASAEIVKKVDNGAAGLIEGDAALEAENVELMDNLGITISPAGIVKNWLSEQNSLKWEFENVEEGEYEVYLYTLTQKYKKWTGGHLVHIECGEVCESRFLTADRDSKGANQKYFGETGSFVGTVCLPAGKHNLKLIADMINLKDVVGLSVSRLELIRIDN